MMEGRYLSFFLLGLLLCYQLPLIAAQADDLDDELLESEKPFHLDDVKAQPVLHQTTNSPPVSGQGHFDDEEFVGFEHLTNTPPPTEEKAAPKIEEKPVELPKEVVISYYLEAFYITLILGYAGNHYLGKKRNDAIAKKWGDSVFRELKPNFSKLSEGERGNTVIREDSSNYRIKATGRVNCFGFQANLRLRKREDVLSLLYEFVFPAHDTVTVDILMNDEMMDPFVFAVTTKKEEKKFKKNQEDIKNFASTSQAVSNNLVAFSEVEELVPEFLTEEVLSVLSQYEKEFISMHFSDQSIATDSYKKSIRFQFRLNPDDPEKIQNLYRMAIRFVDLIAAFRLSRPGKAKVDKHRAKMAEEALRSTAAERQEAAQLRKTEKLQKAKASMSPEKLAIMEEKAAKKELKKRAGRMKVVR